MAIVFGACMGMGGGNGDMRFGNAGLGGRLSAHFHAQVACDACHVDGHPGGCLLVLSKDDGFGLERIDDPCGETFVVPGDGDVTSLEEVETIVDRYVDRLGYTGLEATEVMEFERNYYVSPIKTS